MQLTFLQAMSMNPGLENLTPIKYTKISSEFGPMDDRLGALRNFNDSDFA